MLRLPISSDGKREVAIFGKNITVHKTGKYFERYNEPDFYQESVYVEDGHHGNGGWLVVGLTFDEVVKLVEEHCK